MILEQAAAEHGIPVDFRMNENGVFVISWRGLDGFYHEVLLRAESLADMARYVAARAQGDNPDE